jgi:Na+/melibiose symporter-like transporter
MADMPIQMASIPVAAFVPNYYGADLGLSLSAVGTIWLLSRLFDGFSDPLIGYLSDRTETRWGRRRVWMVASVPIMMLAVYKLFMPVPPVTAGYLLGWLVALWLGWTMLFIPYYAWAAELSPDYNERSLITGWRAWIGMAANVFSKVVPVLALYLFGYGGTREVLFLIGIMTLALLPLTVGLTVWNVPETKQYVTPHLPLLRGLRIMWENGPFKRLVLAFFVNQLGSSVSTATVIFFIRGVLHEEEGGIVMLLTYYGVNLCGIPFWVWLSKRIGKHRAWICGLLVLPMFQPLYLLLGPGDFYYMLPVTMVTGFAGGAFWVLPNSMKADVIDLDTLNSGTDRAAWFFAVWSLTTKIALSIGPFLALYALGSIGYNAEPGAESTALGLWGLKAVFVFGPSLGFVGAALITYNYPLTEERHREIRTALESRTAAS